MNGTILTWTLFGVELVYLVSMLITVWFYTLPVNRVDRFAEPRNPLPKIVLIYPVLDEIEATMRTTLTGLSKAEYPPELLRVISIPNSNDRETKASLHRLQKEFPFLEVLPVPPTTDPSWDIVWEAWDSNPKAYWWHAGKREGDKALPPKRTRQLIWAMYHLAPGNEDALLSYIDADSVVPDDYWRTAAIGMETYDVVQNTNVPGNPLSSRPASLYAMDHISWGSSLYTHMSANGTHPFYVLGRGLFFRFSDLLELGGFHPWLAIEGPEVGMRMWTNGRTLGVVESPLIEEVPITWKQGVTQRKRWVAGYFQSLSSPLTSIGMTAEQRFRARLNLVPCLSLAFNPIGFGVGSWAIIAVIVTQGTVLNPPTVVASVVAISLALTLLIRGMVQAASRSKRVLPYLRDRVLFVLRVNLFSMLIHGLWWGIPLAEGFRMFLRDDGLAWERTEKRDANYELIRAGGLRSLIAAPAEVALRSAVAASAAPVPAVVGLRSALVKPAAVVGLRSAVAASAEPEVAFQGAAVRRFATSVPPAGNDTIAPRLVPDSAIAQKTADAGRSTVAADSGTDAAVSGHRAATYARDLFRAVARRPAGVPSEDSGGSLEDLSVAGTETTGGFRKVAALVLAAAVLVGLTVLTEFYEPPDPAAPSSVQSDDDAAVLERDPRPLVYPAPTQSPDIVIPSVFPGVTG